MIGDGSDYHFIFIVDRSGSMRSSKRIGLARDALTLFMRSLPNACSFSVISFGSPKYEALRQDSPVELYNDSTRDMAINKISSFEADFGMTDILSPLKAAQQHHSFESGK